MRKAFEIAVRVVGVLIGAYVVAVIVVALVEANRTGQVTQALKGLALIALAVTVIVAWIVALIRRRRRSTTTPTGLQSWGRDGRS